MKNWILLVVFISCFQLSQAHVEPTYYLQGTIGNREVGVQIDHFAEAAYLKFFYQEEKTNLYLKGNADSTNFHFESALSDSLDSPLQKIFITHLPKEKWEGIWVSGTDTLIVKLEPINVDKIEHKYANADLKTVLTPYSYLRTSDLQLQRVGKRERFGRFSVSWYIELKTGIKHFQVNSSRKIKDAVNTNILLRNDHLRQIESFFECGTFGYSGLYGQKIKVLFLNESYLSYSNITESSCYSARKNTSKQFTNLELLTGNKLTLEDLLFVGNGNVPTYNTSFWFQYRRNEFAPFIINQLQSIYPENFTKEGKCDYRNTKAWQKPVWYLTKKGLYLGAIFPGINPQCNEPGWSVIPYQNLDDYFIGKPID